MRRIPLKPASTRRVAAWPALLGAAMFGLAAHAQPSAQTPQAPSMSQPRYVQPSPHGQPPSGQPGALPPQRDSGAALDALARWERRDLGVSPPSGLHDGAFHGPTPAQIAGGQLITTKGLVALLEQRELPVVVLHVLGPGPMLPRAVAAPWAAESGGFEDATQQQLSQLLRQATRGQADAPLVFYCASPECWMSYNAALRAIRLGYRNVLWYRGGLAAWQQAGLPTGERGLAQPQAGPGGRSAGALPPDAFGPVGGGRP